MVVAYRMAAGHPYSAGGGGTTLLLDGPTAVENIAAAVSGDVVCLGEFKNGCVTLDGLVLKKIFSIRQWLFRSSAAWSAAG